jgi:transposase-like protein
MEPIDAALAAVDALEPGEKLVYAQIAKKHGVEPTTLRRRHQGLTTSRAAYHENRRALHPQQEIELIQCIDRISKQGLPPSRDIVRRLASQLAQKELRYHWVNCFV